MTGKISVLLLAVFIVVAIIITACSTTVPVANAPVKLINQFQAVWDQVTIAALDELPQDRVSFRKLPSKGKNIIRGDARRTLNEHANVLQPFEMLAYPNGICFKGVWKIDVANRYSDYFRLNSEALISARAPTAMSNTGNLGHPPCFEKNQLKLSI